MPPVRFLSTTVGTYAAGPQTFTFALPKNARRGDTFLIVTTSATTGFSFPGEIPGYAIIGSTVNGGYTLTLMAHTVDGTESQYAVTTMTGTPTQQNSVMLHYRALGTPLAESGDPDYDLTSVSMAGSVFLTPAKAIGLYSDMYLGFAVSTPGGSPTLPFFAPGIPAPVPRYDNNGLFIVEFLTEVVGLVPAQLITFTGSHSGMAASLTLAADALHGVGQDITFDPPGAIGLPQIGV